MLRTILLPLLILPLFASCAAMKEPRVVILQHPETMEFKNCEVGTWATGKDFTENSKCVKKFEEQGYVVWGKY